MVEVDFKSIEKKWQDKWDKDKIFEANPNSMKKYFVSFPYPYVNAYQHIGHFFTLMRVEAMARYKRLKGYNVLFAQAWHATGSPIINAAKRIKEKEPKQMKIMKDMGIDDVKRFEKPEFWLEFFIPEYRNDYKSMGMSVDWRREFHTTSLNPYYDRFIQWQFRKLKEKGYCIRGKFPVVWDPKENVAVGDHDRIEGEGESAQEFYLFKFPMDDGRNIVTATLRHDTSWGITNVYVNPDVEYVEADVNGELWIISEKIIPKLENQDYKVSVVGKILGTHLIGKKVESYGGKKILVLPATFLDPNYGTGMVHSVPSDSADDLIALRDLQKNDKLIEKYGLDKDEVAGIEPIEIFNTPGVGGNSAQFFLDKYQVKSQNDREKLDAIKKELYKLTFTKSTFGPLYKHGFSENLEGMSIPKGQEIIKKDLLEQGKIHIFYELTGRVVSRSLTECVVKVVDDQWFLDYSNPEWKKLTHECLDEIKLYPEKSRLQFDYVIDWLHEWACTREEGLGTKLPWDNRWLIESLSDSTIYLAYYTIAHLIKNVPIDKVDDDLFDYLFGEGDKPNISGIVKMKKEFEYWYPHDFRNSGKDLIQNHLTFYLFNHVAIFPKKYWPKGIGVNGWVTVDGQKMSKSLGNMIPVREMAEQFGADASRITMLSGGEGLDDPNWDSNLAISLKLKFSNILDVINEYYGKGRKDINNFDLLAESRSNRLLREISVFMEDTMFRTSIQKIFFDYWRVIKDYLGVTENNPNKLIFKSLIENYLIMISVFCPHFCEEVWEHIGKKGYISLATWPESDEKKIDEKLEKQAENVDKTVSDIMNVLKILREKLGNEGSAVYLYVIPNELEGYNENVLSKRVQKPVKVFAVNDKTKYDPEGKSGKAKPGKPAIFIE